MIEQKTLSPRVWGEMALLALIWGGSFLSMRLVLDEVAPLTTVLHRTGWAMLVLWGVVALMRLPLPRDPRVWGAFLVMGVMNNVLPFALLAWGQLHIETGLASILNAATAIFGVLVAAVVFADERLSLRKAVGVSLGFLGVATAIGLEQLAQLDLRSLGQLAVIGAAFSYACSGAWARKTLSHLPPHVAAAGMLTAATLVMLPLALWFEGPLEWPQSLRTWGAISYMSIVATAGAFLLYFRVLAVAGSGNLMLVTLMVPPIAITLGAAVLGEALPPRAYGGFALLALGLAVLDGRMVTALRNRI